jgi:serine/threonine protein phosphatase PrpC
VTAEPYVAHFEISDKDEFLILGCDGIWDVVSDEQAVALVHEYKVSACARVCVCVHVCGRVRVCVHTR